MRDVHNQLCIVKRQKTMAAQAAAPKPAAASSTVAKTPPAATATAAAMTPPAAESASASAPTPAAEAEAAAASGPTTISLTGTGTSYSKAEGPIDAKFKEKRQVAGTYQGIKAWGPIDPPGQLGIRSEERRVGKECRSRWSPYH